MIQHQASLFFYGSFINFDVLAEMDYLPEEWEVAKLSGFDIVIRPLANLIPSDQHCVYGILTKATHEEQIRIYEYARGSLGGLYVPDAVLVETTDGKFKPALCYICYDMLPRPADNAYIKRIVDPARKFGFPEWYIHKLESFQS